jgi:predicted ATPase/HPt (histidine-containing phosphotransfer) domain-containing protein
VRVGEFSFDTLLYEGSSTLVYSGVRDSDGARVVGKLGGGQRNLKHEHHLLDKLRGPGVVETLGLFDGANGRVLVQRRFGTSNLAEVLRKGRFTVARALRVGLAMAQICERVHGARVVHRDIKPANILYDAEAEDIALADFGIAVELPVNTRALPVGDMVGTPMYVSPEHTGRTSEGCDFRSDLYSLGVTLYELLTGTVPFADQQLLNLVAAHLSKMAEPPHRRVPSIPPLVSDIVMKLLAKAPDERYQSARGLAADLERCLERLSPDGVIMPFALGRSDVLRPRFPHRLFGRRAEIAVLEQAFARAATGAPTLVLISGREGTGRTALVRALARKAAVASPVALGGWSSANERPLAGLARALSSLADRLLLLDEDQLATLRNQFAARLGHIGEVVLEVAPQLRDVFGAQPALAQLEPAQARSRLHHGFRCLAAALGETAPFVLALQGFGHADRAAVSLIEGILSSPSSCRTLVVLMAQDPAEFGALRERPDAVSIELGPLAGEAMTGWAAAILGCKPDRAVELGEALRIKSAGNPLMFVRLIEHLFETGLIERRDGTYSWSIDAVRAAAAPPTLAALAAQRIAELDDGSRRALAALACSDEPLAIEAVAAMLAVDPGVASPAIDALDREGLVIGAPAGYRAAHPEIAQTALAAVAADELARMRGRLGVHLVATGGSSPPGAYALRAAMALGRGTVELAGAERTRAAEICVIAGEHVSASIAYEAAAALFVRAAELLDDGAWQSHRALQFRVELGCARSLIMLGRNADADVQFEAMARRELSPQEIGIVYASWAENQSMVMNRARAIEVGLEGLTRLGIPLPATPPALRPLAAIRLNQRRLVRLTAEDHVRRPDATDQTALAALRILSTMTSPAVFSRRMGLYVLIAETAIGLILRHGHVRNASGFLAMHACFLHSMRRDYVGARRIYEACTMLEAARPAREVAARAYVVFHYMVAPWFGPWKESTTWLARAVQLGVEAGDPVFAALCASASITMLNMTGTPLDRVIAAIEGWGPLLRGDGGVAANAANIVNIAGKLTRGEPIAQDDLDRVTSVPLAAGPMRNNAMVNLGLALAVIGHEAQVRAWLDEIRDPFPQVNFSQPHIMTLWLLDGLFAAKDVRAGNAARRAVTERSLATFRALQRDTGSTSNDPAIALLEAQLARADGHIDRAAGLFGLAAREARARDLTPLVAYAMEERARMVEEAGDPDEAILYYREAVTAYRRWMHVTKASELEQAHPGLRATSYAPTSEVKLSRLHGAMSGMTSSSTLNRTVGPGHTINDQLDLMTVLRVSQDISTQLHGADVVRAVLTGILKNSGAERVVFALRGADGVDTVYGELHGELFRDLAIPVDDYPALPRSIVRVVRRTGRPLVIADAASDPGHAADPFVVEHRGRSIAGVPVLRNGKMVGFVVLENRMVAGAFAPQLVSLTQALAAQAAISLDNASLYQHLENRVHERTAELNARNAEMRLVLDHVAQGLLIAGLDGRLYAERSAILASWFPGGVPDTLAGFFADDPERAAWFEVAWAQLAEDVMPLALRVDQLPKQLRRGDRTLAFDWQPITNAAGEPERVLVVVSDVTEALRRIAAEYDQVQLMAIFEKLSEDRNGVIEFIKEAAVLVDQLAAGTTTPEVEKRLLHTLKGNAALFGLQAVAERCHEIEDAMALDARRMTEHERAGLASAWGSLHGKLARFIDVGDGVIQVRKADFEAALAALRADHHALAGDVELWSLESLAARFQRVAEQARALADRLGKAPVRIEIDHGGVFIDRDAWGPFWSAFVHAVRNAIDHGLEDGAERARLGKATGALTLRSYLRAGQLVFELSDDGRGVAWDQLRDRAGAAGLPCATRDDLIAAMFHDGMSTRAEVSELSGRGVGLGALAQACRAMGGRIEIDSEPGLGTTLRFEFPGGLAKARRERSRSRELRALAGPGAQLV